MVGWVDEWIDRQTDSYNVSETYNKQRLNGNSIPPVPILWKRLSKLDKSRRTVLTLISKTLWSLNSD